ncbi:MAG: asparagine synthase (glutamine-hydrolyzing) [Steroidobacteraceae bacterium]
MCGISGIVSRNGSAVPPELIRRITDVVAHRGPDGHGYFTESNVALGHRRLSIIDLSEQGHQPMPYRSRYWITYNGEIYNYLELREELRALGCTFTSGTDTEVILAAYERWGANCLQRFNGMWAFAIYDSVKQEIFLARDRFGVKPLYYADTPGHFVFGSEIKQLLAYLGTAKANRGVVIESMLTSIDGHTQDTYFEGVSCFPQAHFGRFDLKTHRLTVEQYYQLEPRQEFAGLSLGESMRGLRDLFEDSVRLRLRSDVRVGTCLSGGLDSSATSGIASRMYHEATDDRFVGIHARSIDAETDESEYAQLVAEHFGIELHIVTPGTDAFLDTLQDLVRTQEEPFHSPSMFMGWHVFERAKALGCKVMLNGQGGDEVLLGYERYFAAFLGAVSLVRFAREALAQARHSKLGLREVLSYRYYFTHAGLRMRRLKSRTFLRSSYRDSYDGHAVIESADAFRDLTRLQVHEIATLQLPHLLRYEDRNSMRHSIETRLPFLDYRLVEFCISIPAERKIHDGWTKFVLRKAMSDVLPERVTWRTDKLGFQAPERTWLSDAGGLMKEKVAKSPMLQEITEHRRLVDRYDSLPLGQRWKYFMIAAWEEGFGVSW